jgi:ankyrin repeat protein
MPTRIDNSDTVKDFVTAAHFNFDKVKEMLAADPDLLEAAYPWQENDPETAIMAAAHMGNVPIAEFLLEQGAPLAIYTAAMLGRKDDVAHLLVQDAANAKQGGAHGIPLMSHVALSGDTDIADMVFAAGGTEGISFALHAAINKGHLNMVKWLIEHGATDFSVKNWQDKTPLQVAVENNFDDIAALLREHGATE